MSDTRTFQTSSEYQVWEVPDLDYGDNHATSDAGRKEDFEQGYIKGFAEGCAKSKAEFEQSNAATERLVLLLEQAFREIDEDTVKELAQLSAIVAEQVIKTELALNPDLIANVVQNLVSQLPRGFRKVQVSLHPEDVRTLGRWLEKQQELDVDDYSILEDESLERGDCRLTTDDSLINAELRSHVENIISTSIDEMLEP